MVFRYSVRAILAPTQMPAAITFMTGAAGGNLDIGWDCAYSAPSLRRKTNDSRKLLHPRQPKGRD